MGLFSSKKKDKSFPFNDVENVATITCCHVMKEGKPILHVSHDADDGMWQFLCGEEHTTADAMVVALRTVYETDPSVAAIANLPYGGKADRESADAPWQIY